MVKRHRFRVELLQARYQAEVDKLIIDKLHYEMQRLAVYDNDIINIIETNHNDDYYSMVVYYKS